MNEENKRSITDYIASQRERGVADEDIKKALTDAGWSEGLISAGFTEVGTDTASQDPTDLNGGDAHKDGSNAIKYIIVAVIAVLVIGGASAGAYFAMMTLSDDERIAKEETEEDKIEELEEGILHEEETKEKKTKKVINPDTEGWDTYRNEQFGFEFMYPQDIRIVERESHTYMESSVSRDTEKIDSPLALSFDFEELIRSGGLDEEHYGIDFSGMFVFDTKKKNTWTNIYDGFGVFVYESGSNSWTVSGVPCEDSVLPESSKRYEDEELDNSSVLAILNDCSGYELLSDENVYVFPTKVIGYEGISFVIINEERNFGVQFQISRNKQTPFEFIHLEDVIEENYVRLADKITNIASTFRFVE